MLLKEFIWKRDNQHDCISLSHPSLSLSLRLFDFRISIVKFLHQNLVCTSRSLLPANSSSASLPQVANMADSYDESAARYEGKFKHLLLSRTYLTVISEDRGYERRDRSASPRGGRDESARSRSPNGRDRP